MLQITAEPSISRIILSLQEKQRRAEQAAYAAALSSGLEVEAEVVKRTPVDTGRLRNSIKSIVQHTGTTYFAIVSTDVAYARYVEYGTKPHDIYPVRAKALAFKAGGRMVFAARVHHPGFAGAHMFRDGYRAARGNVLRYHVEAARRIVRG